MKLSLINSRGVILCIKITGVGEIKVIWRSFVLKSVKCWLLYIKLRSSLLAVSICIWLTRHGLLVHISVNIVNICLKNYSLPISTQVIIYVHLTYNQ